jgi:hypothetical protein
MPQKLKFPLKIEFGVTAAMHDWLNSQSERSDMTVAGLCRAAVKLLHRGEAQADQYRIPFGGVTRD